MYHTRVQLHDNTWTSMSAGGTTCCKAASEEELHSAPDECALLLQIHQVKERIDSDRSFLDRHRELFGQDMERNTKDSVMRRIEASEKELGSLRKHLGVKRAMRCKAVGGLGAGSGDAPRCFLPTTILRVSANTYIQAEAVQVGDSVISVHGQPLVVLGKIIHEEDVCDIVELRTRGASLRVTTSHRIAVPMYSGLGEKYAYELEVGDSVMVHKRVEKLVKKLVHKMRTEVVELRFSPDEPLESFSAERWGMLTYGSQYARSIPGTDDSFED